MNEYLDTLKQTCYQPNFWCSEEYFRRAGWEVRHLPFNWVVMRHNLKRMLPAINIKLRVVSCYRSWAGFSDMDVDGLGTFLDREFIYDPSDFVDLSGSRWKKVRKNLRWAEEDAGEAMVLNRVEDSHHFEEGVFWKAWAKSQEEIEWYDQDVVVDYMMNGDNRLYLIGQVTGLIWAEIIWDENWSHINFRYCMTLPGVRGLSDYARVAFYRWLCLDDSSNKLVNDGGSLGSESLNKYKMKLNPIQVGQIKTYQRR